MSENEQKKLHARDLRHVIEKAIRRLPNGKSRLTLSDYSMSYTFFSNFEVPDFAEIMQSDYGMPSGNDTVEKQFFEEITTIEDIMLEVNVPIKIDKSGSRLASLESYQNMMKSMNLRAYAIRLWDWYGIPWRIDGSKVHIIYSPEDLMGTPIIRTISIHEFLNKVIIKLEDRKIEVGSLTKKLDYWRVFGIIMSIVMGIIFWIFIQRAFGR
jgi:hypothetical protein